MLKLVYWDDVKKTFVTSSTSAPDFRVGTVPVASGATSVVITFSSPIPNADDYTPIPAWQNFTDEFPQYQPLTVTAFDENGMTVSWNAPVDTANYKIGYQCHING